MSCSIQEDMSRMGINQCSWWVDIGQLCRDVNKFRFSEAAVNIQHLTPGLLLP